MIREIGSILFLESNFNVWKSNKILIINFCSFLTPSFTSLYSSLINVVFSFLFTCSLNLEPLALYHHHHNKQNKYKIRWKRLFITTLESEIEKLNEMKQKKIVWRRFLNSFTHHRDDDHLEDHVSHTKLVEQ